MLRRLALRSLPLLLAAAACPAGPLRAQAAPAAPRLAVHGEVLDVFTGEPLRDAVVRLPDARRSAVTDSLGCFTLSGVPAGAQKWVVGRLGYASWEQEVEAEDGAGYTVRLLPRPQMLEGITVVADRFEQRRRAVAVSVRAVDRRSILASAAGTAFDLLSGRVGVTPLACSDTEPERACALVRGRVQRVGLTIDDVPAPGGLEQLATYLPQELYLVESYGGGRRIRVYTTWYVERLAKSHQSLPPLVW